MKKGLLCVMIVMFVIVMLSSEAYSQYTQKRGKTSADLLKEGLLGAGAGAVGGAASGAKGGELWKGALAGAGVNIVGGALLDSISGQQVDDVQRVDSTAPRAAYSDGYEAGYSNGYKKGYTDGYKASTEEQQVPQPPAQYRPQTR